MIKYKIIYSKQGKTVIKLTSQLGCPMFCRRSRSSYVASRKTIMENNVTFCSKINKKETVKSIFKLRMFLRSIG